MEKLVIFRCPKIMAYYNLFMMCFKLGHLQSINYPFGTNGKLMVLGVPILNHLRVDSWVKCNTFNLSITEESLYRIKRTRPQMLYIEINDLEM